MRRFSCRYVLRGLLLAHVPRQALGLSEPERVAQSLQLRRAQEPLPLVLRVLLDIGRWVEPLRRKAMWRAPGEHGAGNRKHPVGDGRLAGKSPVKPGEVGMHDVLRLPTPQLGDQVGVNDVLVVLDRPGLPLLLHVLLHEGGRELGEARGGSLLCPVPGGIFAACDRAQHLPGLLPRLVRCQGAIRPNAVEALGGAAPAIARPVADDKGLASRWLDPQPEALQLGVPQLATRSVEALPRPRSAL